MTSPQEQLPLAAVTEPVAPVVQEMRGVRAGFIVLVGVVATNAGNYAFHVGATRLLGPTEYGVVVSLLTISSLLSLPVGGIQLALARSVARQAGRGEREAIRAIYGRSLLIGTIGALAVGALMVAFTPLIERWLSIGSAHDVALTAAATVPAILAPVVWGVAQGLQRFTLLAVSMAAGAVVRVVLVAIFGLAGLAASGALAATFVGGFVSVACAAWPLRHELSFTTRPSATARAVTRTVMPVVIGILAMRASTAAPR
jgi:O-antigen/teichoic acid export membrane protein